MLTLNPLFKYNLDYEKVRQGSKEDKVHFVQKELRKVAEGKWYGNSIMREEISLIAFSSLTPLRKSELVTEALILFPQDLLTKKANYDRVH